MLRNAFNLVKGRMELIFNTYIEETKSGSTMSLNLRKMKELEY